MPFKKTEPWQRKHIWRLSWVYLLASIAGMLGMFAIGELSHWLGWGRPSPGLIFIPWLVAGGMLIPAAFQKGVELERQRNDQDS